jgi:Predicted nucleoside-diphosphate sugar epimerases
MDQIRQGGPVTVTNPEMTRFIMPIDEAAELVLTAHERLTSGEVFVLKMNALRIGDLAETMIEQYASEFGHDSERIDIDVVGARPAERIHERLISADESVNARELERLLVILPHIDIQGYDSVDYSEARPVDGEYTSADREPLEKDEIVDLLERSV